MSDPSIDNIKILTFGCRLNAYESEVMVSKARAAGLSNLDGGVVLVNTCAVTAEAVRQAKQAIRSARKNNPSARIVVSGCAAQIDSESFGVMNEVDLVLGNEEKLHQHNYRALPDFGVNTPEKIRARDIMGVRETVVHMVDDVGGRARAFVQVQNGCDHRCTFCVIPFGRGNSRSVLADSVVEQVRRLVENGHAEIVITGVDTTSYGHDLPGKPSLGKLVQMILKEVPELPRLRLSSIDSIEVDQPLLRVIENEPRFMPHLHLSIQSGDNLILKRMKRRHTREDTIKFCQKVRKLRPDIVFGADFIAGFPTETEEMFENSLRLIDQCGITYLHVFPFSSRQGTPAARMPQFERFVIKQRASRMRRSGEKAMLAHLESCCGQAANALIERDGFARSEQFTPIEGIVGNPGDIIKVRISGHNGNALLVEQNEIGRNGVTDRVGTVLEPTGLSA